MEKKDERQIHSYRQRCIQMSEITFQKCTTTNGSEGQSSTEHHNTVHVQPDCVLEPGASLHEIKCHR